MNKEINMKKQKGQTLIEAMVVFVIIGILVAIIVPRLPYFKNKYKNAMTEKNITKIDNFVTDNSITINKYLQPDGSIIYIAQYGDHISIAVK